jgi:hypothetical protein
MDIYQSDDKLYTGFQHTCDSGQTMRIWNSIYLDAKIKLLEVHIRLVDRVASCVCCFFDL